MAQLRDIQDPQGPLLSRINGARDYAYDFQHIARDFNELRAYASVGANIDARTSTSRSCVYRIRGAKFRRFGSTGPEDGDAPIYSKIYICDAVKATEFRDGHAVNKVRRSLSSLIYT